MNEAYYMKRLMLLYLKYNLTNNHKKKALIANNISGLITFIKESEFEDIDIPQQSIRKKVQKHF